MKRVVILLLIAAGLAVGAAIVTYIVTLGAEERALARYETAPVLVSTGAIPTGVSLAAAVAQGLAAPQQFPVTFTPTNAITAVTPDNSELVALADLPAGRMLLTGDFGVPGGAPVLLEVPPDRVAVTFAAGETQRVANFVEPGSYVTVLSVGGNGATSVVFSRVLVLAVGDITGQADVDLAESTAIPTSLVTVAIRPEEVQTLVEAISNSEIYLGLLGADAFVPPAG